jgi:two-component system sensor histidine kinase YesM
MVRKILANMKMKQKIILVSVVPIALIWIAILVVMIIGTRNIYDKKIDRIIQQTVEQTSKYVSTEYANILHLVHYSVVDDDLQNSLKLDVDRNTHSYILAQSIITPILTQLQIQNQFIDSAGMILKDKWFYGDNYIMSYNTELILEKVKNNHLIYWSTERILNEGTRNEVIPVVLRVPNGSFSAENEAYMIVNIDAEEMFDYLSTLEKNLQCNLIIHSGDQVVFGNEQLYKEKSNGDYFVNDINIDINNWTLSCLINKNVMYDDLNRTIFIMLLFSVLIAALCVILALWVSTTINLPIKNLTQQVKKFEEGDFATRSNLSGNDEIGQLGNSFNSMCRQIELYIQMLEEEKLQVQASERQKGMAEMKVLQSQINPHFLYNTLDSIYWYSLSGKKDEVSQIIMDLSLMLRIGLSKGAENITIENEIKHVENYLMIQKTIFYDKFNYKIEYDKALLKYRIMKILLQPLVENSLIHGFSNMETGGIINVNLSQTENKLIIRVSDNGCGFKQTENMEKQELSGYALINISERLKLQYGDDAKLMITSEPYEETVVEIEILLDRLV